ncbi:MAG: hypothetical protein WBO73_08715 [Gammaproteobacteria bacterium]|jgi:hypothetical protein
MGRLVVTIVVSGLLSVLMPVQAADDAYLKMLEGEAASVQLDHGGQLKKQEKLKRPDRPLFEWNGELRQENTVPTGLDREQFETFLQKNYYGTYVFYNKLNTNDRDTVYYRYSKADKPGLENIRKNVMALLKQ